MSAEIIVFAREATIALAGSATVIALMSLLFKYIYCSGNKNIIRKPRKVKK